MTPSADPRSPSTPDPSHTSEPRPHRRRRPRLALRALAVALLIGALALTAGAADTAVDSDASYGGETTEEDEPLADLAPSVATPASGPAPVQPVVISAGPQLPSTTESTETPTSSLPPAPPSTTIGPTPTTMVGAPTSTVEAAPTTVEAAPTTVEAAPTTTTKTEAAGIVTAIDDTFTITKTGSTVLPVTDNDVLGDGPFTLTVTSGPSGRGTAVADGLAVKYRPDNAASGIDSFAYEICATGGTCDVATVTVTLDLQRR